MNVKVDDRRMSEVVEYLRARIGVGAGPIRAGKLAGQARARVRRIAKESRRGGRP